MTQEEFPKPRHATPPILMRFLPNSHTLIIVFSDGSCSIWTPEDGSIIHPRPRSTSLVSAAVSSRRTHLLTVDSGQQGRVYQLPDFTEIPIPGLEKNVTQLAISSDNQTLYVIFSNGDLRMTKIATAVVDPPSKLMCTGVVSAQSFPANPRLLLFTRTTNNGGRLSFSILDRENGAETTIGDSFNPVKASLAPSGNEVLLLTDDQRFLKLTLHEIEGQWTVPDDSVVELATGVIHFNCPADSPFAVVLKRNETQFLSLQDSNSSFVMPFSGALSNESMAKWDKASSSQDGLWFAVTGNTLECWPAKLQHYVETNAGRQLTADERKRYAIRDIPTHSGR